MTKEARLAMIRARVNARPVLSETAAETLAQIREEDPDLGSANAFGECLAPDDVRKRDEPEPTEDESEENVSLISPAMREAIEA